MAGIGFVNLIWYGCQQDHSDYVATSMENPTRNAVEKIMKSHWRIEVYHRRIAEKISFYKQDWNVIKMGKNGRAVLKVS